MTTPRTPFYTTSPYAAQGRRVAARLARQHRALGNRLAAAAILRDARRQYGRAPRTEGSAA